jgi:hypothetical protein
MSFPSIAGIGGASFAGCVEVRDWLGPEMGVFEGSRHPSPHGPPTAGVEDANEEVYEPTLRELNALPCVSAGDFGSHYVTFEWGADQASRVQLGVRVAPRNNEVGLRLWEAGFLLAGALVGSDQGSTTPLQGSHSVA